MSFTLDTPITAADPAPEPRARCETCATCVYCRAVDEVEIACLIEPSGRLRLHTRGLWQFGVPELYLTPPEPLVAGHPELAVFLATALLRIARHLTVGDPVDPLGPAPASPLPPGWPAWHRAHPVRFALGRLEPPPPHLAEALAPEVDSVLQVTCSLWPDVD